MYPCPTQLGQDISQIAQVDHFSEMELAIRIAYAGDKKADAFDVDQAILSHYQLAHYHKAYEAPPPQLNTLTSPAVLASQAQKSLSTPQMTPMNVAPPQRPQP